MELLKPEAQEWAKAGKWAARAQHFIGNYLRHHIDASWDIVSFGCGGGDDVEVLRDLGYKAYGLDPSRHAFFSLRKPEVQRYLRQGRAEDMPFGEQRFDFGYSLEVIEHVGCRNFGTVVLESTEAERVAYMRACFSALKPDGRLLLTTSNRRCLIDIGHPHKYHALGRLAARIFGGKLGPTLPWHRKNFVPSIEDIRRYVQTAFPESRVHIRALPIRNYPRVSSEKSWRGALIRTAIRLLDNRFLRLSPLCPIVILEIRRR